MEDYSENEETYRDADAKSCINNEINKTNILGSGGEFVSAYANLMNNLWISSNKQTSPRGLKSYCEISYSFCKNSKARFICVFNYAIDVLSEDLNRGIDKPQTEYKDFNDRPDSVTSAEHWIAFLNRSQSVIVDLMCGQLKSSLICNVCKKISNKFDTFLTLSLPIPKNKFIHFIFLTIQRLFHLKILSEYSP
ncbi:unnamed protein product [Moneuplotes crassus]|uniref:ubiquitinyl hydrolase 1 n=1 Tax=Euplotes crassus TaxID=5936 RepID=A0AAD2DAI9_EUPCR|nr:unnamed protein product [Moneuplotes crassus]